MAHLSAPISLPARPIERVLSPFSRFMRLESAGGIVLIACTLVAVAWANSPWAGAYHHLWETPLGFSLGPWTVSHTLHHWINDGLMAVFFFLVGLEIKREALVGELTSLRKAALPAAAALGGMVVPALLYAALNAGGAGAAGWGIPMATDIAFALGVLALMGPRVPLSLKVFLTALAIVDDIGAVLVIALFYTGQIAWGALGGGLLVIALAALANRLGVRRPIPYLLLGIVAWSCFLASGVHATVAGVLMALTIPSRTRIDADEFLEHADTSVHAFRAACERGTSVLTNLRQQAALQGLENATEAAQAPLQRIEHDLHVPVAFGIIPLFALANAGVTLSGGIGGALAHPVTLGVILGLVIGKPLGIMVFSWLAVRAGIAELPAGTGWKAVHAVSWLGGIGFTMSLFVAGLAFPDGGLVDESKVGIFAASLAAGLGGWLLLRRELARARPVAPSDVRGDRQTGLSTEPTERHPESSGAARTL
ncbi:Na+/H+ antiporter NhaA [Longimicrobium sp.]|uniref:Na+/H+ antiporter NhaA n=1 Tax=Longimicrobium sp. TaxID=2029185 RepID=UPI002E373DF7|nr:Na+/H+ antiporter NhaA [Longimicrobium sp.]HEX6038249.1 Na+/H+ antiporter NhaA [Longimicrobium sp.]